LTNIRLFCINIPTLLNKVYLIKSGGGTGPMIPQQPFWAIKKWC